MSEFNKGRSKNGDLLRDLFEKPAVCPAGRRAAGEGELYPLLGAV